MLQYGNVDFSFHFFICPLWQSSVHFLQTPRPNVADTSKYLSIFSLKIFGVLDLKNITHCFILKFFPGDFSPSSVRNW